MLLKSILGVLCACAFLVLSQFVGPVRSGAWRLLAAAPLEAQEHDIDPDYEPLHKGYISLGTGLYIREDEDLTKMVFRIEATEGRTVRLVKAVAYHTSRGVPVRELSDRCDRTLDRATAHDVEHYHREQREWYDAFWAASDVQVSAADGRPLSSDNCPSFAFWARFYASQNAAHIERALRSFVGEDSRITGARSYVSLFSAEIARRVRKVPR